jgi:hypothetical protein
VRLCQRQLAREFTPEMGLLLKFGSKLKSVAALLVVIIGVAATVELFTAIEHGRRQAASGAAFQVNPTVRVSGVKRFGVNLGTWTSWGAEQLCSNVLKNPGFGGLIDRAIVIVSRADERGFVDNETWLGREDGFWSGAHFDVRTGPSAGSQGLIIDSRASRIDGLPEFLTAEPMPNVEPGDVIAVTRVSDNALPTEWWFPPSSQGLVSINRKEVVPGGYHGARSLALDCTPAESGEVISYLDAIGQRAGKLLPVNGRWRLSFWSRAAIGNPSVTVEFLRNGTAPFISKTFPASNHWAQTALEFDAVDNGPASVLELHLKATGGPGRVLLGGVDLRKDQDSAFPFRQEVVEALTRIKPGYIRDWQGQLGDTVFNRLAAPLERRSYRYRPGPGNTDYGYSIPEFLDLCVRAQASPWIILPTTISDDEAEMLGQYVETRSARDHFAEVVIEFGNENWNPLFRPAGIPDPQKHGEAADRAFRRLREAAGPSVRLTFAVNGQFANPDFAGQFLDYSAMADTLAVAPYFVPSLMKDTPPNQAVEDLFPRNAPELSRISQDVAKTGKSLAVYEVNLHTIEGSATPDERDPITTGAASGAAVAGRMLRALQQGATRQCIYVLAGYDAYLSGEPGTAKLWGITRDLAGASHFRPSGLGLCMINEAISGDLVDSQSSGVTSGISLYPFSSQAGYSAVIISALPTTQNVSIQFPVNAGGAAPTSMLLLDAPSPFATNEIKSDVTISQSEVMGSSVSFQLPPYGLAVLLPKSIGH